MFIIRKNSKTNWTVGMDLANGKFFPVQDHPTKVEASRHAAELNREAQIPGKQITIEEFQLVLFDKFTMRQS